jgi:hypothetical protein
MSYRVTGISDKIPKQLQELFELLLGETFWLREQWQMYEALYGYSEERLNLLKRSAPSFFYMVNLLFADSFILSLCRLGDHPSRVFMPLNSPEAKEAGSARIRS